MQMSVAYVTQLVYQTIYFWKDIGYIFDSGSMYLTE
jgi:hypothetical protein